LWEKGAAAEPTSHPDVLRVIEADDTSSREVPNLLKTFAAAADQGDFLHIQATLVHQIPTFAPFIKGQPT
jgi:hypothetical protein